MKVLHQRKENLSILSLNTQPTLHALSLLFSKHLSHIRRNHMTRNQIALAAHKEVVRHNRVSERHEHRDVVTRERLADASVSQAESAARNATTNWWLAQETQRANQAKEQETLRHNVTTEQLQSYGLMTQASAMQDQARAALRQAAAAEINAATRQSELAESIRHNQAFEQYQVDSLKETTRHNKSSESIGYAQVAESRRSAMAQESISRSRLSEDIRHNMVGEDVARSQAINAARQTTINQQRAVSDATRASASMMQAEAAKSNVTVNAVNAGANVFRSVSSLATSILRGF